MDRQYFRLVLTITSSLTGMLSALKTVVKREDVTLMSNSEFGFNFVEYYNRSILITIQCSTSFY